MKFCIINVGAFFLYLHVWSVKNSVSKKTNSIELRALYLPLNLIFKTSFVFNVLGFFILCLLISLSLSSCHVFLAIKPCISFFILFLVISVIKTSFCFCVKLQHCTRASKGVHTNDAPVSYINSIVEFNTGDATSLSMGFSLISLINCCARFKLSFVTLPGDRASVEARNEYVKVKLEDEKLQCLWTDDGKHVDVWSRLLEGKEDGSGKNWCRIKIFGEHGGLIHPDMEEEIPFADRIGHEVCWDNFLCCNTLLLYKLLLLLHLASFHLGQSSLVFAHYKSGLRPSVGFHQTGTAKYPKTFILTI